MQRTRDWRRAQTQRYKAKSQRDYLNLNGSNSERPISDTRHSMDCGHRCLMCHAEKLVIGHSPNRQAARRDIEQQIAAI